MGQSLLVYPMNQTDQHRIVILEKNQDRRENLRSIVSGRGYLPFVFEKETICLDNLISLQPDLIISGQLSNNRMYWFVNTIKMIDRSLPVLIITGDLYVKGFADSNGFDNIKVLKKNFEPTEIKRVISSLIRNRYAAIGNGDQENPLIIGNSSGMLKIKKRISKLKHFNEPVLIQGEPGTGKELIARAIHHQSDRCNSPFTKVHMAEMNPNLLEDIIFNFDQNGFQDPDGRTYGNDSLMDGGTLFLDGIAVLPASDQARLLAVFERGALSKFAEDWSTKYSLGLAIVVSSSNLIEDLLIKGKFRKDLYYRMSVVSIGIPPLRERIDDIPLLTDFFITKFCMDYGADRIELPKKIKDSLSSYPWPGNVRELKSYLQRVVLYGEIDGVIQNLADQMAQNPDPLNFDENVFHLADFSNLETYLKGKNDLTLKKVSRVFLLRAEKKVIKKALKLTNWNRKKAAGLLDISYKSLLNKIKEYRLAKEAHSP